MLLASAVGIGYHSFENLRTIVERLQTAGVETASAEVAESELHSFVISDRPELALFGIVLALGSVVGKELLFQWTKRVADRTQSQVRV